MLFYKSKDFSVGLKVEIGNYPYIILENKFVNPGKGQAFNKIKLKNIINETVLIKTVKIGEKLKVADIYFVDALFLYEDNNLYFFMNKETSENFEVSSQIIDKISYWLKIGIIYSTTFWNDIIISIKPPKIIDLKVISSDDINKNSVVAKNMKYVILETNLQFKVPLFIKNNDVIRIDTEKQIYISRI